MHQLRLVGFDQNSEKDLLVCHFVHICLYVVEIGQTITENVSVPFANLCLHAIGFGIPMNRHISDFLLSVC